VAAVCLGPELPLKLHQAPDPGAVGADVRLDLGGQLADGRQVDAEQLRAPLQRRRDRPAQVLVVPKSPPSQAIELTGMFGIESGMLPRPDRTPATDGWPGTVEGLLRLPHVNHDPDAVRRRAGRVADDASCPLGMRSEAGAMVRFPRSHPS
jgi:hypothetical protein